MKKTELKPCPFKHKKQSLEFFYMRTYIRVHCSACGTLGPYAKTKQWAIRKWNARSVNHDS